MKKVMNKMLYIVMKVFKSPLFPFSKWGDLIPFLSKYTFIYFFLCVLFFGCAAISQVEKSNTTGIKKPDKIEWQASFKDASEIAKAKNKPMMLVFYGVSSKRLDENVFSSPNVIKLAQEFVCMKLGSDQNDLTKRYKVGEFPTVVFTDSQGGEYDRVVSYKSASSFASVLEKALIPAEVDYSVQIGSDKQKATVKCIFKNIRQKSLVLYLQERSNKPSSISYNSTGDRPDLKEIGDGVWQMDFNTPLMKTATIQYEVNLNVLSSMDFTPAYISYVGDEYGILDGHGLFLLPQDFHVNGKIRVQLNLPDGLKAITPWEEEAPLSFSANYIQDVTDSVFCIGQFQSVKRNIGEKEVYAVHCGSKNIGSELERKADTVTEIFKDYISRFGDFPFKKYIAIFAERTADGKYVHGSAHGVGFAGPIDMPLSFTTQFIAHELFHVWNGRVITQKSQYEVWFKEGFTQYYGYLTPYRTGLYSKEQFLYYLRSDYKEYLNKYKTGEDIALARVNEGKARIEGHEQEESIRSWVMYRKGALVAFLVDDKIRESTNGKKNLDDLMRYMFLEFHDREYSSDDILKALNAITNQDFTDFFSNFVYGRTKLPLTGKLDQKSD